MDGVKIMTKRIIDCSKTKNYINEKLRMTKREKNGVCKINCRDCPLCFENNGTGDPCLVFEALYPEKAIEAIQKWSDKHPQKTYLMDLLEKYPNIPLDNNGKPSYVCPHDLGLMSVEDCKKDSNKCVECWDQPIEDGKENV